MTESFIEIRLPDAAQALETMSQNTQRAMDYVFDEVPADKLAGAMEAMYQAADWYGEEQQGWVELVRADGEFTQKAREDAAKALADLFAGLKEVAPQFEGATMVQRVDYDTGLWFTDAEDQAVLTGRQVFWMNRLGAMEMLGYDVICGPLGPEQLDKEMAAHLRRRPEVIYYAVKVPETPGFQPDWDKARAYLHSLNLDELQHARRRNMEVNYREDEEIAKLVNPGQSREAVMALMSGDFEYLAETMQGFLDAGNLYWETNVPHSLGFEPDRLILVFALLGVLQQTGLQMVVDTEEREDQE